MRTRVTCFLFFPKKLKELEFLAKYSYPLAVTADLNNMSGCTHEEADTRVFLRAADCVKQGHKKIIIRIADTDVVVLAISVVEEIKVEELW